VRRTPKGQPARPPRESVTHRSLHMNQSGTGCAAVQRANRRRPLARVSSGHPLIEHFSGIGDSFCQLRLPRGLESRSRMRRERAGSARSRDSSGPSDPHQPWIPASSGLWGGLGGRGARTSAIEGSPRAHLFYRVAVVSSPRVSGGDRPRPGRGARWSRISCTTAGSIRKAMIRIRPPHSVQVRGSTS